MRNEEDYFFNLSHAIEKSYVTIDFILTITNFSQAWNVLNIFSDKDLIHTKYITRLVDHFESIKEGSGYEIYSKDQLHFAIKEGHSRKIYNLHNFTDLRPTSLDDFFEMIKLDDENLKSVFQFELGPCIKVMFEKSGTKIFKVGKFADNERFFWLRGNLASC